MSIVTGKLDNPLSQPQSQVQPAQKPQPEKKSPTLIDHIASLKNNFAQIHQQLAELNARLNSLETHLRQKEEVLVKSDEELGRKITETSQELNKKVTENSEEIRKLNTEQDKRTGEVRQKLNDDIIKISHLTDDLGRNLRELKSTFDGGMTKLSETKLNKGEFDAFRDEVGQVLGKLVTSLEESFPDHSESEPKVEQVHVAPQQPQVSGVATPAAETGQNVDDDVLSVRVLRDDDKDKRKFSWWK